MSTLEKRYYLSIADSQQYIECFSSLSTFTDMNFLAARTLLPRIGIRLDECQKVVFATSLNRYALDRLSFSTYRHFIDNNSPSDAYGKRSVTCAGLLKELDRIAGMLTLDPRNLAHIFMALLVDLASDNALAWDFSASLRVERV